MLLLFFSLFAFALAPAMESLSEWSIIGAGRPGHIETIVVDLMTHTQKISFLDSYATGKIKATPKGLQVNVFDKSDQTFLPFELVYGYLQEIIKQRKEQQEKKEFANYEILMDYCAGKMHTLSEKQEEEMLTAYMWQDTTKEEVQAARKNFLEALRNKKIADITTSYAELNRLIPPCPRSMLSAYKSGTIFVKNPSK